MVLAMQRYALVSVYDKTGLESFARAISEKGYTILSTGGTADFLRHHEIEVVQISEFTGYPEICDGRVKSLHPKIHAGILARRDNPKDMEALLGVEAGFIDLVVVNLYPFIDKYREMKERDLLDDNVIEFIDIGGPTLLRAAAKNWRFVTVVSDPNDYAHVKLELIEQVSDTTRRKLAAKVFTLMSAYDGAVAQYMANGLTDDAVQELPAVEGITLRREYSLRYGENPHQNASLYRRVSGSVKQIIEPGWRQLQGKELSYNNLIDFQAAVEVYLDLITGFSSKESAVIIKHMNPCGAAVAGTPEEAFQRAREGDPISAFGGIIVNSGCISETLAKSVLEGFVEIFIGEEFSPEAREVFATKKNIRVIEINRKHIQESFQPMTIRDFFGDYLIQSRDLSDLKLSEEQIVVGNRTVDLKECEFAWRLCKSVKSNAIVITKNMQAIGIGAGQMNRVDSARISINRAQNYKFDLTGAIAASDAFLPFPDTLEVLADAGVKVLIQPGGSVKDKEVITAAEKRGVTMLLTGERHFRH